jgi:redox-sensitive bicupin YhaK (pirin superfamily)
MSLRAVKQILETKPTIEGAGVKLERAFGFGKTKEFDPFLLFDDFRNENPADYLAGFPWHPHRGIETITYVLAGEVAHGDSLGNKGRMTSGDVQWMTAGSGIRRCLRATRMGACMGSSCGPICPRRSR